MNDKKNITYRRDIDGLRALAVLAVVIFHASPETLPGGFVGVDIFFVISGFLITSLIFTELQAGRFSFIHFYGRRIRRIFPALALVLSSALAIAWFVSFDNEFRSIGRHVAGGAAFVANLLFWQEAGYFDKSAALKPLLHLWSLGVEEQFYIGFPVFAVLIYRLCSRLGVGVLILISLSFAINLQLAATDPTADFYSPLSRMWELGIGSALAVFPSEFRTAVGAKRFIVGLSQSSLRILREFAALLGIVLIGASVFILSSSSIFPGWSAVLPTVGCGLLIWAGEEAAINHRLLAAQPLVWLGLISFPLYLWHWPMLSFLRVLSVNEPPISERLLAVLGAVVLAWLTYTIVEKPFRFGNYRHRKIAALSSWMLLVGVSGYVVYLKDGLPARAANKESAAFAEIADPYRAMRSDGSCESFLDLRQNGNETCIAKSANPQLMIMGDSHAMAFNSAIWADRVGLNTVVLAGYSCLPFRKYIPHDCVAIAERALGVVSRTPSISTVLLVNIGGDSYTDRPFSDGEQVLLARDAFVRGYTDLISELQRLNKKVIFVVAVPGLLAEPRQCFQARALHLRNSGLCEMSRADLNARYSNYKSMIAEVAHANPELLVYDPTSVMCDNRRCFGTLDGRVLYFDVSHLSVSGSARLLDNFVAWYHDQGGQLSAVHTVLPQFSILVNDAAEFKTRGHWSEGYEQAHTGGSGVVVGPGTNNSNVFAQRFLTSSGTAYKVVARAASTNTDIVGARIQVNWEDAQGRFLSVSAKTIDVDLHEVKFEHYLSAPDDAAAGVLYVTPAGDKPVRYSEMRLLQASPMVLQSR